MHLLEAMAKHRPVDLGEYVATDLGHVVRTDTKDVRVVGRMVDLAQGKPVRHDWVTTQMVIGKDVGRVDQRGMAEPAQCAAAFISAKNLGPEQHLMQATN